MNKQASASTSTTSVSQDATNSGTTITDSTATLCAKDLDSNSACGHCDPRPSHIKSCFKLDPTGGVKLRFGQKYDQNKQEHGAKSQKSGCKAAAADQKYWWNKTRIHVALLGLTIAAVNCYAQATFCIAIVEMILPADYVVRAEDPGSSQARHLAVIADVIKGNQTLPVSTVEPILYQADQSCPIELKYRDYYDSWRFPETIPTNATAINRVPQQQANQATSLLKTTTTTASGNSLIDISNRFDWDAQQQGLLLGAFAIGTAPLQVIGGRLAEIYGSKWVLLMGCIGTGLTNLTIPYIAHFSFVLLLINRVIMGIAQAGMEPGLMCLLADWLTPQEAGFFISMLLFAICMGFFLGSLCSSFILALGYGWPLTYYIAGSLNLLVALIWYIYADSWPHASKYISQNELDYITAEQRGHQARKQLEEQAGATAEAIHVQSEGEDLKSDKMVQNMSTTCKQDVEEGLHLDSHVDDRVPSPGAKMVVPQVCPVQLPVLAAVPLAPADPINAPWLNILATPSVWAFIICKISIRWCADVLANELPLYLANVLHLSIKINGLLNSMSAALFAVSSFVSGWLANEIFVKKSQAQCGGRGDSGKQVNKTHVRKAFQSVASFGSAICIILMTKYDCDIVVSMSMLLILSCCLVMGTGGELQIPYDMTSRYPGTLHGMACTLSVSGWLAPPLIGLILGDQPSSRHRWSIVWYSTAAINIIGGLVFVLFADASPKDFDRARTVGKTRNTSLANNPAGNNDDLKRQSSTRSHRSMSTKANEQTLGYTNSALSNSSCENSPKHKHNNYLLHTHVLSDKLQQQQAAEPSGEQRMTNSEQPVSVISSDRDQATLLDGEKLFKRRQLESSFIRPGAYNNNPTEHNLDSPHDRNACPIVLPIEEDLVGAKQQDLGRSSWSLSRCPATVQKAGGWQRASLDLSRMAKVGQDKHNQDLMRTAVTRTQCDEQRHYDNYSGPANMKETK